MRWDDKKTPALWGLFYQLGSSVPRGKGRRITVFEKEPISTGLVHDAIDELRAEENVRLATADHLAAIAALVGRPSDKGDAATPGLMSGLQDVVDQRWDLARELAAVSLAYGQRRRQVMLALPRLVASPEMLDAICDALENDDLTYLGQDLDYGSLSVPTRDQIRRLLSLAHKETGGDLAAVAMRSMSHLQGWSSWLKLFGILFIHPELAEPRRAIKPHYDIDGHHWHRQQAVSQQAMSELWDALTSDRRVQDVARMVQDLDGVLRNAPPDLRTVYSNDMLSLIENDSDLRKAAIEALLWFGRGRTGDFALYTVMEIVHSDDVALVQELTNHPDRETQYRAKQVALANDQEFGEGRAWPRPKRIGVADRLYSLTLAQVDGAQNGRTWLGDSLLESMIERTVLDLETQVANEYPLHHGVGEEKLMERFFTMLSDRFEALDLAFLDTARALGSGRRTSVRMQYRSIDKSEEGKAGIARPGQEGPSKTFAADLCLIIDPYVNGRPLGRRATLVQAKRLYPRDRADASKGWNHSYQLDSQQTTDLVRQTSSSIFLFQGPGLAGRGLPVLPAQLVSDLAYNQSATGNVLGADAVGTASRSFADWFTYDVLALRVGDPYGPLVAKAEKSSGSMPYDLFRYGAVEVQVMVDEPIKGGDIES
jgi:hypothetical protein